MKKTLYILLVVLSAAVISTPVAVGIYLAYKTIHF